MEGHVSFFIACAFQCGKLVQHRKCCAMCSPHQPHISAVQLFPYLALAHPLSNPNVHNVCINATNLFSVSNLDYGCPIWCTPPLQMHFMHSKQIHFISSAIPILLLYFHPSKPLTQLPHSTRTFKIRHFGIVYQDSKDRPCPLQRPTPSFA